MGGAAGPWAEYVESHRAMKRERDGDCICDHNPETLDGPDERCPWHGRAYYEWVERGDILADEVEALRAKLARVEATEFEPYVPPVCDHYVTQEWRGSGPEGATITTKCFHCGDTLAKKIYRESSGEWEELQ